MGLVLGGWWFVAFIYYKVALDAVFDANSTIIAVLILSVICAGTVFGSAGLYSLSLVRLRGFDVTAPFSREQLFSRTVFSFTAILICFCAVQRLVIFGFSKALSRDIESRWGSDLTGSKFLDFFVVISLPVVLHYLSFFVRPRASASG